MTKIKKRLTLTIILLMFTDTQPSLANQPPTKSQLERQLGEALGRGDIAAANEAKRQIQQQQTQQFTGSTPSNQIPSQQSAVRDMEQRIRTAIGVGDISAAVEAQRQLKSLQVKQFTNINLETFNSSRVVQNLEIKMQDAVAVNNVRQAEETQIQLKKLLVSLNAKKIYDLKNNSTEIVIEDGRRWQCNGDVFDTKAGAMAHCESLNALNNGCLIKPDKPIVEYSTNQNKTTIFLKPSDTGDNTDFLKFSTALTNETGSTNWVPEKKVSADEIVSLTYPLSTKKFTVSIKTLASNKCGDSLEPLWQDIVMNPKNTSGSQFKNCTELNKVYPGGVALPGAVNAGGTTKKEPKYDKALYTANKKSDRDKDGIACEK